MRQVAAAIEAQMGDENETPRLGHGSGPPDFEWLAKRWASWCIENLTGDSLKAGLSLAGSLAEFAHCDAVKEPPEPTR